MCECCGSVQALRHGCSCSDRCEPCRLRPAWSLLEPEREAQCMSDVWGGKAGPQQLTSVRGAKPETYMFPLYKIVDRASVRQLPGKPVAGTGAACRPKGPTSSHVPGKESQLKRRSSAFSFVGNQPLAHNRRPRGVCLCLR